MSEFKLLICGSRNFNDYHFLHFMLNKIFMDYELCNYNVELISGHCSGTDKLAEKYAKENDLNIKIFEAQWKHYGRAAGPIRNKEMIDYISNFPSCNLVVAFVSPESVGTLNTIKLAEKLQIPVIRVDYIETHDLTHLDEGISVDDSGNVLFDWQHDTGNDIIKLQGRCIHKSKFNNTIRYYGYRAESGKSKDKSTILQYIKTNVQNDDTRALIEKCVADFAEEISSTKIDYIIPVYSSSTINTAICNEIKKYQSDAIIISTDKKPTTEAAIDEEAIRQAAKGDEKKYEEIRSAVEKLVSRIKSMGVYSSRSLPAQYKRYLVSMITFDTTQIKNSTDCTVLIVDDITTSGETLKMVMSNFKEIQFEGTIIILNLVYNQ